MTSVLDPRYLEFDGDEEEHGFEEPPKSRPPQRTPVWVASQILIWVGLVMLGLNWGDFVGLQGTWAGLLLTFGPLSLGAMLYAHDSYGGTSAGMKHDGITFSAAMYRGWIGWLVGIGMTAFYVLLYFYPWPLWGVVKTVDPLARLISGGDADQYFLYGFLYTVAVVAFGVRMFYRYRHDRYHLWRTASVMVVQLGLAFLIPQFLKALDQPEFYPTYFWPLQPEILFPSRFADVWNHPGGLGVFMVFWSVAMIAVATPILTYLYGKRWYCSWVCGCGGLAETLGDPYRQLSDKSTTAWKLERGISYSVLVAIVLLTISLWVWPSAFSETFRKVYGFLIISMFAGVIGTGFYPVLGSRVWCRFGCPLAAILGIFQRYFSRFRITTNGGQCMSCGNCSTFCEMGIDVRAYAQQGKNIIRSSCVGCGVCSAACPRGVLKLENGMTHKDRYDGAGSPVKQLIEDMTNSPKA